MAKFDIDDLLNEYNADRKELSLEETKTKARRLLDAIVGVDRKITYLLEQRVALLEELRGLKHNDPADIIL
jgi:hypothetical protein